MLLISVFYPFPKRQILDSSKLKEVADNNFKFYENDIKFSKRVEKHYGKRRNCSLRAISPFPAVFSKDLYCRHLKTRACLGKGYSVFPEIFFNVWLLKHYITIWEEQSMLVTLYHMIPTFSNA